MSFCVNCQGDYKYIKLLNLKKNFIKAIKKDILYNFILI